MPGDSDIANEEINKFISDVQQGKVWGSYDIAFNTVNLLKKVIAHGNWQTAQDLVALVSAEGRKLTKALPLQASVGNMVRRVLKIIREEYVATQQNKQEEIDAQESLHKIVTSEGNVLDDYSKFLPDLHSSVMEHIGEFEMELETSADNIAQQARQHIHSNEIIMTLGKSASVEAFLKKAATERKFEVIVAECAPFCRGHELAVSLGKSKIQTTVIADSAIFAIMSRVNKVIIGTHTVMASGGLRAVCGSHIVALAAKHYSVPVIVLAPMYKLSPQFLCSYDQDAFNSFVSPEGVLKYSDGAILSKVHVYNPVFDYVPPELVTLFISNTGGHAPSYVYRLLSELYHPEDNDL
ncbi:translation initiation factor eIF-2B subunit beta [Cryptotermes secundus]|uniref:translation initiation factor eIF-2B subunit beta n=1 Tax=Cryptotermes secundus TaxID=105785 RepID=UPI001454C8B0|nr:translation initiation factor eIF-2B subunit beta [Cryptotermes secundus]